MGVVDLRGPTLPLGSSVRKAWRRRAFRSTSSCPLRTWRSHVRSPDAQRTSYFMEKLSPWLAGNVEFDVHQVPDRQFSVFHDWTLDWRTEGHDVMRERSLRP